MIKRPKTVIYAVWSAFMLPVPLPAIAAVLYDANNGVTTTTNTQSGWIAATTANNVTYAAVGAGVTIASRDRGTTNTDGVGADTANNNMWRDFIFAAGSNTPSEGMDITISGLIANKDYNIRLWAFDDSSNGTAGVGITSMWNGSHLLNFQNSPDPSSLNDYTVAFTATTDGSGNLVLQGRAVTNTNAQNVFINGFELDPVPEPGPLLLLGLGVIWLAGLSRSRR